MKSIQQKLLLTFLITIASIMSLLAMTIFVHFQIVNLYKNEIDTMIAEYSLIDKTTQLVSAYNNYSKYAGDQQRKLTYTDLVKDINDSFIHLDAAIIDPDSVTAYHGLKNSIQNVIAHCNTGMTLIDNGNITEISLHYNDAAKQLEFVKENATDLLLKELNYAQVVQKRIIQTRTISFAVMGIIILIVSLGVLYFATSFSRTITAPIASLSKIAQAIAEGNLKITVADHLKKRSDEFGSLAQSFNVMIENLRKNISQLNQSNQQLIRTKDESEQANKRLAKMNQFMVNREIRMMELKKELESFKKN